jgi:hypothetical protein
VYGGLAEVAARGKDAISEMLTALANMETASWSNEIQLLKRVRIILRN